MGDVELGSSRTQDASRGRKEAALLREIEGCDIRLRCLTVVGQDDARVVPFRRELAIRRAYAAESLAALRRRRSP